MKVKQLKNVLKDFDDNAEIKVCYTHDKKHYFQEIKTLEYNQNLKDDKIIKNENLVMLWLK